MKKLLLIISLLIPVFTYAQKKSKVPSTYDLLIGTYTKGSSKGIYVYRFYTESGKLAYLSEIDDVSNPSYLCVSNNNKFIYAVNENKSGEVSAFTFDPVIGTMKFINKQSSAGDSPCYVSVDKDQKNVFVANYGSGSMAVLPVNKDGSLNAPSQVIQDAGKGTNPQRQEGPHGHSAVLSNDNKYLLFSDLGLDKVNVYRYKSSKPQPLIPADPAFVSVTPGNGPRHTTFSADGKYVYLLQEMGSMINVYNYDGGKLKQLQSITMMQDGFKGTKGAAALHISPDGKFLYASNRLDASGLVVYSIDPNDGQLTFVARYPSYGKNPRDFAIDPTGNFLVVANQDSDSIYIYRIDKATGRLSITHNKLEIGNPVCVKFTAAQ